MSNVKKGLLAVMLVAFAAVMTGCGAPRMAKPSQLVAPAPIEGSTGKFMNPYTQDGVLAKWVDKAVNAQMGATAGRMVGAYAGRKAMEQIPFIGGMLGAKAGDAIGRKIAIESSGGMEYIKETSDTSFNTVQDLSVYLYVKHSSHKHFQAALKATQEIYPELKQGYYRSLQVASSQALRR